MFFLAQRRRCMTLSGLSTEFFRRENRVADVQRLAGRLPHRPASQSPIIRHAISASEQCFGVIRMTVANCRKAAFTSRFYRTFGDNDTECRTILNRVVVVNSKNFQLNSFAFSVEIATDK